MCSQQTPAQALALENSHLSFFTYLPNSFLIPLAFFLESGDGGVICRLSASFERGGRPARSKWSADPFSVSAVRKQNLCHNPLVQDCTEKLLTLGMTPVKLLTATMPRKWGKEGWENPWEMPYDPPSWAWLVRLQGNTLLQLNALYLRWENPPRESSCELNPKYNSVPWQGTKPGVPKAQKAK